jgi:hypothetical protein
LTAGPTKVLYMLGTQRGGSTIVGRVIGTRPGFAFGGEVRRLWARGVAAGRTCGCGRGFDACPLWSKVLPRVLVDGLTAEQVAAWQHEVAPRAHSWIHAERIVRRDGSARCWPALEHYRAAISRMYQAMADELQAGVVVDTSKLPADAAVLLGVEGVEPYFLHLVRDPRGVVHSQLRRDSRTGGSHRWRVLRLSAAWALRHGAAGRLARLTRRPSPAGSLRLRYEDFVADPSGALDQVARLVGTQPVGTSGDGSYDLAEVHTAGGRLPARSGVRLELDDRWHSQLSALDTSIIGAATLPWLLRFGYPLTRPRHKPMGPS